MFYKLSAAFSNIIFSRLLDAFSLKFADFYAFIGRNARITPSSIIKII